MIDWTVMRNPNTPEARNNFAIVGGEQRRRLVAAQGPAAHIQVCAHARCVGVGLQLCSSPESREKAGSGELRRRRRSPIQK